MTNIPKITKKRREFDVPEIKRETLGFGTIDEKLNNVQRCYMSEYYKLTEPFVNLSSS